MRLFGPVILIGAARSGTKMLRDILARHPEIDCVPYDVNYIWKMGNESVAHDELKPEQLTESARRRIYNHITRYHRKGSFLIEKSVSNSLRVEFVNRVFPNAKFLYLFRNGIDVVESTFRQWNAPPDWRYILKKARTFPVVSAFGYGVRYLANSLYVRRSSSSRARPLWGVRYQGIQEDLQNHGLYYVCAEQWARSNRKARQALETLPPDRVMSVRYEQFVESPEESLKAIAKFIGVSSGPILDHVTDITSANVGKGRTLFDEEARSIVVPILDREMQALGYAPQTTLERQSADDEVERTC